MSRNWIAPTHLQFWLPLTPSKAVAGEARAWRTDSPLFAAVALTARLSLAGQFNDEWVVCVGPASLLR